MNIYSYVDKYGKYNFEEVPFNEVDNAVFSLLSYINLKGIVSKNKITLNKVGNKYFEIYPKKTKKVLSVKRAIKLLRYIKDTKRYKDLIVYNYVYRKGKEEQFCALTIEINPKLVYVSFEGTDDLVSGWREDFILTYKFPVRSQIRAINYINRNFIFNRKKIILGGHSKGGNLALVAGMYASSFIKNRIIKIYNNDGPGLLKEQFESKEYFSIKDRLVHIIPYCSVVGILLHHDNNFISVRTLIKGLIAHDMCTWVVKDNSFMRKELDNFNESLSKEIIYWLDKYNLEEREKFVKAMFDIFERAHINSLLDVTENKKLIIKFINESKEVDEESKEILKDFIGMIIKCFATVKKEEIKNFIETKFNKDKNKKDCTLTENNV